jgi:hypothetical protein
MEGWLTAQSVGATRLVQRPEQMTSNWLLFRRLPRRMRYCETLSGFPIEHFQDRTLHQWPIVPFNRGVLTFASPDRNGQVAPGMPVRFVCDVQVRAFLDDGWKRLEITPYDARRRFADLGNQAFESFLQSRGLTSYEGSLGRRVWWGNIRTSHLRRFASIGHDGKDDARSLGYRANATCIGTTPSARRFGRLWYVIYGCRRG